MPTPVAKAISGVIPILIRSSLAKVTESFKQECVSAEHYHGLVTACWQNCQPGKAMCRWQPMKQDCAMSTVNQVMSVALVANAIYAKYAEAYPAATKAASEMTAIEKRFTEVD